MSSSIHCFSLYFFFFLQLVSFLFSLQCKRNELRSMPNNISASNKKTEDRLRTRCFDLKDVLRAAAVLFLMHFHPLLSCCSCFPLPGFSSKWISKTLMTHYVALCIPYTRLIRWGKWWYLIQTAATQTFKSALLFRHLVSC